MSIFIGRAPLAGDVPVHVDPNRLFGRHLAVLGNTGSGKSCTVAQLLRSSVAAAGADAKAFRAIVLDLNGEYDNAFDDLDGDVPVRRFSVMADEGTEQLRVPAWLWNYSEWLSFADASAKSQAPQLRRALHLLRTTDIGELPRAVVGLVAGRRVVRQYEAGAVEEKANSGYLSLLANTEVACRAVAEATAGPTRTSLIDLADSLDGALATRRGSGEYLWRYACPLLDTNECAALLPLFDVAIELLGVPEFLSEAYTVDTPIPFDPANMLELLPLLAADGGSDVVGWIMPMVERLRIALSDDRLQRISGWDADETIEGWLKSYLSDGTSNQIAILDLSLVPSHVLHLVTAAFARVILEALERHRREPGDEQAPVILVVEEAHALIRGRIGTATDDEAVPMARLCREAFERIAREGRKFGLSLVVSSQRPSELSETVLSQCNTFLIHRLVNDHDQRLVHRMVPDSLKALTDELPALPSQTALLLGWAIDVPTMVRIRDLAEEHRPHSEDPDLASAWRGDGHGTTDWSAVATAWTTIEADDAGGSVSMDGIDEIDGLDRDVPHATMDVPRVDPTPEDGEEPF